MSLIIDSCSLINVVKAGLADELKNDPCLQLVVGPVVREEVWRTPNDGRVLVPRTLVTDIHEEVDASELVELMDRCLIGPGEAEAIILADRLNLFLFCDDRRGRRVASDLFGEDRVIGTLGLALHLARESGCVQQLYERYDNARAEGAFLPSHTRGSFAEASAACRPWPCGPDCVVRR